MKFYEREDWSQLTTLVGDIKKDIKSWYVMKIKVEPGDYDINQLARSFGRVLHPHSGAMFVHSLREILVLIRLGPEADLVVLQTEIHEAAPEYSFSIRIKQTDFAGLAKIEIVLKKAQGADVQQAGIYRALREGRGQDVIMVVDDDMFIRSLLVRAVSRYGTVVALPDGAGLLEKYKEVAPNIVYIDIHLPGVSGLDLLKNILHEDPGAYVIILSADSTHENVREAIKLGAKWFLAKPIVQDKVDESHRKYLASL